VPEKSAPRKRPAKRKPPAPRKIVLPKPLELGAVTHGPTWQLDAKGEWILPERTLGWEILGWTREYLLQPDGPDAGKPWNYTDEQARLLLWWYAIDERGRFMWRRGMLRRAKGWGKDPFGATVSAVEFVGPCRFDRWNADGEPVAKSHPAAWIQIAAVSKDQTRNTMTLFPAMLSPAAINEFGIDLGKEILFADSGRRRLEAVTSSPRALEGGRTTFTLKNETQHWLANNDGHEMAKVIARNLTKSRDGSARALAIANAPEPGEDSDAERDWDAYQAIRQGRSRGKGFLYDSIEAPPDTELADEEQLRAALIATRGDSEWLDIDRHVEEIYDPQNTPATSRRFYLNQLVAAEDAWIAPHQWDQLAADLELRLEDGTIAPTPEPLEDGQEIALGFDGGKTDDHCVLIGCRISDGFVFTLGNWDPDEHEGEAPRELIDGVVRNAMTRYVVCAFFADLAEWESYIDTWALDFGKTFEVKATAKHAVAWDMRGHQKETTIEIEALHTAIEEKAFRHDGNPRTAQHFHNARRWPNTWGVTVRKEHRESKRKIDAVPATMLARLARWRVVSNPKRKRRKTGKAVFI